MIKKSLFALLAAYLFCVFTPVILHLVFADTTPPSDSYFTNTSFQSTIYSHFFLGILVLVLFFLRKVVSKLILINELTFFHFLLYLLFYNIAGVAVAIRDKNNHLVYTIDGARKIKDTIYGYIYPPNSIRHEIVRNADTLLLEATYSFDSLGRRVTHASSIHKPKSVLFFGCSFTYGDGINNEETLPSQYAIMDSSVNVYNYAIDGWGPQQSMLQICRRDLSAETLSDTAIGIYVWIDDHLKRASLYKSHYQGWTQFFPCFILEKKVLVYKGSFEKEYPVKGFLFELLNKSIFFDNIEIPSRESEEDYQLAVAMLNVSRDNFLKKFKHGRFIVFMYPASSGNFITYLKSNNIDYVVGDKSLLNENDFIPKQNHPNKYANQKAALFLQPLLHF